MVFSDTVKLAEGIIKCPCGNDDYRRFCYMMLGFKDCVLAGCTDCDAILGHEPEKGWIVIANTNA